MTDVIVGFRWPYAVGPDTEPLQAKLDNLRRFADDVMAKVASCRVLGPGDSSAVAPTARELGQGSMAAVEARDRDAWLPCSPTTPWSRTLGPSAFDPEGKGPSGPRGHRRLLRQRDRRQRVDPVRHPPVVPVRR